MKVHVCVQEREIEQGIDLSVDPFLDRLMLKNVENEILAKILMVVETLNPLNDDVACRDLPLDRVTVLNFDHHLVTVNILQVKVHAKDIVIIHLGRILSQNQIQSLDKKIKKENQIWIGVNDVIVRSQYGIATVEMIYVLV